jgi:tRNA threonylcarbamoyladenosine biosynthesis protein TsaB
VTILAVDTTSEWGGVAIRRGGKTIAEVSRHAPDGFAHVLFFVIEEALEKAGLTLDQTDGFATASGPGSFTGVRVGLSAVKGLAEATGKPAAGISSLKALASLGKGELRVPVLAARRGQMYVAVYDARLGVVIPEAVVDFAEWKKALPPGDYEFIGVEGHPGNLAVAVAEVAERDDWDDPAALDANYVRRSDAELFWRDDR